MVLMITWLVIDIGILLKYSEMLNYQYLVIICVTFPIFVLKKILTYNTTPSDHISNFYE